LNSHPSFEACHEIIYALNIFAGYAKNGTSTALSSKPSKLSPVSACYSKGMPASATAPKESLRKHVHRNFDESIFSEHGWIPKMRDEKGTTKDPQEPDAKVGQKVRSITCIGFLPPSIIMHQFNVSVQVIIVDPNRSGYFNYRALAVVSRERYSRSGSKKFKEVEVHCTEANVLQDDTFWLPSRSLDLEIWSPAREARMRIDNKMYQEHVRHFQGTNYSFQIIICNTNTQIYCHALNFAQTSTSFRIVF
jgi:hypothetical protein